MFNQELTAQIQQDLNDARMLLEKSGGQDERKKYRKAAEIILLKTLHFDPENEKARALLQYARSAPAEQAREDVAFVVAPTQIATPKPSIKNEKKKSRSKVPFALIAMVALGGGVLRIAQSQRVTPTTLAAPPVQSERDHQLERDHQSDFKPARLETPRPAKQIVEASSLAANPRPRATNQVLVTVSAPPPIPISTAMGKLAVSSPIPAEIYAGDRWVGSTPTTLQLPVGTQTLEYRHQDLRTVITHEIKPDETVAASIAFQITVPINAKPWAQVYLEGQQRRPLGQTPLSGATVPVGGVLVFENPNFTPKTYRITEKDKTIQVNFP